jgi:hypothetical protein
VSAKVNNVIADAVISGFISQCLSSKTSTSTYLKFANGVVELVASTPGHIMVEIFLLRIATMLSTTPTPVQKEKLAGVKDAGINIAKAFAFASGTRIAKIGSLFDILATDSKTFVSMLCGAIDGLSGQAFTSEDWKELNVALSKYTELLTVEGAYTSERAVTVSRWSRVDESSAEFGSLVSTAVCNVFEFLLDEVNSNIQAIDTIMPLMSIIQFLLTCHTSMSYPAIVSVKYNEHFGKVIKMIDILEKLPDQNTSRRCFVNILEHNFVDLRNCRRVVDES